MNWPRREADAAFEQASLMDMGGGLVMAKNYRSCRRGYHLVEKG